MASNKSALGKSHHNFEYSKDVFQITLMDPGPVHCYRSVLIISITISVICTCTFLYQSWFKLGKQLWEEVERDVEMADKEK